MKSFKEIYETPFGWTETVEDWYTKSISKPVRYILQPVATILEMAVLLLYMVWMSPVWLLENIFGDYEDFE